MVEEDCCWFLQLITLPISVHNLTLKNIQQVIMHKRPNSKYVGLVCDVSVSESEIMERSIWSEYQQLSFEGMKFVAIKDTNSYLTTIYGDYMKLPPKEQQVPKHDFEAIYWK